MTVVGSCNEWWIRPNNYLSKLTSVFHECGKGSVSWWLNTTNVNIMMNINIGIKRWSSHETSHISMSEICEFRVHSTYEYSKLKENSIFLNVSIASQPLQPKFQPKSRYIKTSTTKCLCASKRLVVHFSNMKWLNQP